LKSQVGATGGTMSVELDLVFTGKDHVEVRFGRTDSGKLKFTNPLTAKDRKDIQWYLEVYGSHWSDEPDDIEARRIADKLPVWGKALFDAVFGDSAAARLFNSFQDQREQARLLTIRAEDPAILSIPWELLHDSKKGGVFLFHENPRISIRRGVSGATGGVPAFKVNPRDRLHLLFVVSRPEDASFLDPRADARAVLDALEKHAPGRFTWEFLRPATIDALVDRIEDKNLPPVDILHFDGHGMFGRDHDSGTDMGYLVFEQDDGKTDLVSAQQLGENLHRQQVPLIILSACQTAAHGDNRDPMSSVAARLTAAGIPAVLAMSHSVLVPTTRMLFGQFYKDLARVRPVGESLDIARRFLKNNPRKYEVQRGPKRIWLELQDWFLPALYQSGEDVPLLTESDKEQEAEIPQPSTNLPKVPEAGFFGRRRELWNIEKWFSDKTRRITITGFGGQGKTALAEEAGRWLVRTGMFKKALILRYNEVASSDALGVAVSTTGSVLGETLIDAKAVEKALKNMPTLVILDNLEALADEPLRELLTAAVQWSKAGGSRVLCTTRKPDFGHPEYRVEGSLEHRRISLTGLAPGDALEWYTHLMKLPPEPVVPQPKRDELITLFDKVKFHPLSIRVLAQQLKTRRPVELGPRLEHLIAARRSAASSAATDTTLPELVASLQLSLDRLDETARQMLPRLGVFQCGAMESELLAITEIGEDVWPALRRQLEAAALMEVEPVPGVIPPFFRFHPTLAPMLWEQLSMDEQARLSVAHRQQYYGLVNFLYREDSKNPHEARAIAWRELPNILHAAHGALDAADGDSVEFVTYVNKFLNNFGLKQESVLSLGTWRRQPVASNC
jgi:CHAT domain-containing protein